MQSEQSKAVAFSIVIVSWNGLHHLRPCIASLLPQMNDRWELLVVDNGSTDGSKEYIDSLQHSLVRCIALPANLGFAEANNVGAREASGKWILLLNNDTVSDPQLFVALEKGTKDFSDYQIFACRIIRMSDGKMDSAGLHFRHLMFAAQVNLGEDVHAETPREVFGASGGAMLFRRDIIDDIGLFDPTFFAYQEDVDFAVRARLAGYRCLYLPSATVYHKGGGTSSTNPSLYTFYNQRNLELVVQSFPRRLLWKYLPLRIAYSVKQVLRFAAQRDAVTVIRAKFAALVMICRRRRDPDKQRVSTRQFDDFLKDRFSNQGVEILNEVSDYSWSRDS
jgi:GT2 family glycosyltransferase